MTNRRIGLTRRRGYAAVAGVLAGVLALSACGQGEDPAEPTDPTTTEEEDTGDNGDEATGGEEVNIRFSWWGSDARHQMNQELIDAYEADNPGVKITPDYTDWGGYWDKLATQSAGNNTPDVLMQEERYLREYASRGILANLADYDIDTSKIDPALLGSGEFDDGLWGIATGGNVAVMMADPQIFEEAGVDMPDDTTWTWDDFTEIVNTISANTESGTYGFQDFGIAESYILSLYARQHGQNLWDVDGNIGFDAEVMAERWQMSLDWVDSGAIPEPSLGLEVDAGGPEQSLIATNRGAISTFWSNQFATVAGASGRDLVMLRYPGESQFEGPGMFLKPAMAISMSERSEHKEEAAAFIDWMLNSEEAGAIILSDRGLPSNSDVLASILDQLNEAEQAAATFIEDLLPDIGEAPPAPPKGAGEVNDILKQANERVMFGQVSPIDGAQEFIDQATAATGD